MNRILLAFLFLVRVPIAGAQVYTITDLGPLSPTAINTWAQVVGNINGHAFIWERGRGLRDLGTLTGGTSSYAASINDHGVVTGTADGLGTVISQNPSLPNQQCSDLTQPFVWTPWNGMHGLGTVGPADLGEIYFSFLCDIPFYGTGVNDRGQVVGYTGAVEDDFQWGFLWTSAGGMTLFGSTFPPTWVNGVSNTGRIVGQTGIFIGDATSWKGGVATTLADLGGGVADFSSSANGTNDRGGVVGWSTNVPLISDCYLDLAGCPIHAVLWTHSGAISDLGTLPGDTFSTALDINNCFGQVIGSSGNALGSQVAGGTGGSGYQGNEGAITVIGRPFIWSAREGMRDLNTRIPAASGWVLNSVSDINMWGQIVGSGTLNGQSHGFLLTP
jgi:uncharacterized membrane protein